MATSKSIVEYTGRRITYETPLGFAEVAARFEKALNKSAGGPAVFRVLGTAQTKEELEAGINALTAGGDFVYGPVPDAAVVHCIDCGIQVLRRVRPP